MRLLLIPALLLSAPAVAQIGPPGAHSFTGAASTGDLIARSRGEEAAIVLRDLRAVCASDLFRHRSRCREGLRLLAEARDEMMAQRAAAAN